VSGPGVLCARCHRLAGNTPASQRLDALAEQIGGVWVVDTEKRPAEVLLHVGGEAVFKATGEDLGAMAEAIARDLAGAVRDNQPPPGFVGRLTLMVGPPGSGKTPSRAPGAATGNRRAASERREFFGPETRSTASTSRVSAKAPRVCARPWRRSPAASGSS
jgi:hypothetical protein